MTHYVAGLGSCGGDPVDGTVTKVVALSHLLMGTVSNGNPYCGLTITINYGGKSTTALVVDKCMGCSIDDIDLSDAAYAELEESGVGRSKASWHFS